MTCMTPRWPYLHATFGEPPELDSVDEPEVDTLEPPEDWLEDWEEAMLSVGWVLYA